VLTLSVINGVDYWLEGKDVGRKNAVNNEDINTGVDDRVLRGTVGLIKITLRDG